MKPAVVMVAAPIHPIPPRHGAAVEWWMWQVCRQLTRWVPHIVSTWAEGYERKENLDGVAIQRIHLGKVYKRLFQKLTRLDPWGYAARTRDYIEHVDAKIVHVHNDPALFRNLVEGGQNAQRRYLLHLHNERADIAGLKNAELLVVSEYLAHWYRERLPEARISVVTNGVNLDQFTGWRASPEERYRQLPELDRSIRKVVLYAGRISPEKGVLRLVHAMRNVMAVRNDVGLVIVGEFSSGSPENERVRYGLTVKEAMARLPSRRGLCLGVVAPERIDRVFGCADLVVMPSEFQEPLGMVALEAMAAGVPLLAAYRGGLKEIVQEGETGFFIPEGREDLLSKRILELLADESRLDPVVQNARRYVMEHHGWRKVARDVEDIYDQR